MSGNLNYLYDHLPARYRRSDPDLFLKRFLSWFGSELDGVDEKLDSFYLKIKPETAPEEFIEWWLYALFGWSWFPSFFTLEHKRSFYSQIAQIYARRGTAQGIEQFLRCFGIYSKVHNRAVVWGESVWGESLWTTSSPLGFVVQIYPSASAVAEDFSFWGDFTWGQSVISIPTESLQRIDVEALLRFEQPASQEILIDYMTVAPKS